MNPFRKRNLVALGAAGALLVGAGAAVAATQAGPPQSPPGYGQQQGGMGYGLQHGGMGHGLQQGGNGYGVRAGGVVMDAAADYIGIDEAALAAERHDGRSLAQIAVAHGKTAAGLQQALVAAFRANLDTAVAAGRITEAQAAQALTTFQSRVQTLIDRTATGPVGGRGAGLGLGPCGGMR
jgi:hypothetical protein